MNMSTLSGPAEEAAEGAEEVGGAPEEVPGKIVDEDGIAFVPFKGEHSGPAALMTLREYHFPENIMAAFTFGETYGQYGVAAVDEASGDLAGYYVGKQVFPRATVGLGRKNVANLAQICTSSKYQKRGIATRLGKYMIDGQHPDFNPDDYDEIIVQDTDAFNSPSWLFSDRCGFRYFPTHEIIKRLGLLGYIQICLNMTHVLPGQFLKRLVKSDEESKEADAFEEQKGVFAYFMSGLLPCTYWALHYVLECKPYGGVDGAFVGYLFAVVYLMLGARFALAHLLVRKLTRPVFREYDFWWGISISGCFGHVVTILAGFPLLGYTGGWYIGGAGINYYKQDIKRAMALVYLPINLLTLMLFLAHTLLRVFESGWLQSNTFVDVLGHAAFYFSITDLALFTLAFPSGAAVMRRWNVFVFAALWLAWLALTLVTVLVPEERFLYLYDGACKA